MTAEATSVFERTVGVRALSPGRYEAHVDPARLVAFTDLWWPAVFGILRAPAAVPTIQLTVHLRAVASAVNPPVLARVQTRTTIAEGHLEETGELWSTDGVLLAESRQLALLRV